MKTAKKNRNNQQERGDKKKADGEKKKTWAERGLLKKTKT